MMSAMSQLTSGIPRTIGARIAWLTFAVLTALLAFYWVKFAYNAYLTAIFPGQIDYGEGIVWQQALLIPGPRMYGDLQAYPYLVFHYPPVYHLVVHAAAFLGAPWLVAGRVVSMISAVALAALAAAFVYEATSKPSEPILTQHAPLAGALITGLSFVTLEPFQFWAYTMRVDMLATAFQFLGMYLGLRSLRQPSLVYPAALAFVLALYTKQTMLTGAVATFAVVLLSAPARALRAALLAILVGGLIFVSLTIYTDGGFPRHIILYNVNRFSLRTAYENLFAVGLISIYPIYLLLCLGAIITVAVGLVGRPWRATPPGHIIAVLYFVLATASLVALGKSGSASNYLIPWDGSWALIAGLAVVEICRMSERTGRALPFLVLLCALIVQASFAPKFGKDRVVDPQFRREYAELIGMARRATKPILADDMVVLMQAGKEVPWEPSIISELSSKGLFDERKVIKLIDTHALAFAVVTEKRGNNLFDSRYSPAVAAALAKEYPVERQLAGMRVLQPIESNYR